MITNFRSQHFPTKLCLFSMRTGTVSRLHISTNNNEQGSEVSPLTATTASLADRAIMSAQDTWVQLAFLSMDLRKSMKFNPCNVRFVVESSSVFVVLVPLSNTEASHFPCNPRALTRYTSDHVFKERYKMLQQRQ